MTSRLFILGSTRSGTSTVQFVMNQYFNFEGNTEGHITNLLYKLMCVAQHHFRDFSGDTSFDEMNTITHVGLRRIEAAIAAAMLTLIRPVPGKRWCDKTPGFEAILAAPYIHNSDPQTKFIHIVRDGAKNIESRARKFPTVPFDALCMQWTQDVLAWARVREILSPGSFLELRLDDFQRPDLLFQRIEDFTGVKPTQPAPAVLPRIEETADYSGKTFWTEQRYKLFSDLCAEAMQLYDFPMGTPTTPSTTPSKAVVFLPPPSSRWNIECHSVADEFIGVKTLLDGVWIFLHPGMPSEPDTCICYKYVSIVGHNTFMARLKLEGTVSAAVKFILEIRRSNSDNVMYSNNIDINAGETTDWQTHIPELDGIFDVSISSRMASTDFKNECSWAFIQKPRFVSEDLHPASDCNRRSEGLSNLP
ncbi:MAG: sulfotransferase [Methylocella sp.]